MAEPRTDAQLLEQIDKKSMPTSCGCRVWLGHTIQSGHGTIFRAERGKLKTHLVHRVVYTQRVGAIPEGLQVLHRCDVPQCVNPEHLWLGTNEDNHRDKALKDRGSKGLSFEKVHQIRALRKNGHTCTAIAEQFGVTVGTVSRVTTGKRRYHVPVQ